MISWQQAHQILSDALTPLYGAAEADSIARIVGEDAFSFKNRSTTSQLDAAQMAHFEAIKARLLLGEPVQYILGKAYFYGLFFQVNPAVLIPRQETEELVAWVLEDLKQNKPASPILLDIGLGSGCIGISIKKKYRDLVLWGIDLSAEALEVAQLNAREILQHQDFHFVQADILTKTEWSKLPDQLDIVVSNPPYIPRQEAAIMPLHVRAHEPEMALFVTDDHPLVFYHVIAQLALERLRPGGALYFECNEFNALQLQNELSVSGFLSVELKKDLSNAWRMIKCIK
jgi:release factor glutamine methyltransferase